MQLIILLLGLIWVALVLGLTAWARRTPAAATKRSASGARPTFARNLARDLLAGGVLFILVTAFFWRTLGGDVYQPADGGDLVSFLFPTYRFAAGELAAGRLPLWNPALYGGAPLIGDIQAGFLYLPNLLLFLTAPTFSYTQLQALAILHLFWAGLGMYVLLRTLRFEPHGHSAAAAGANAAVLAENSPLGPAVVAAAWRAPAGISRPAALFGALAFALCDPLFLHLGNLNLIAVLSWLPWTLAAYIRALAAAWSQDRRTGWSWAALAGLLLAAGSYAGHAQSTLYVGLALAIYTVGWLMQTWFAHPAYAGVLTDAGAHAASGSFARVRHARLWTLLHGLALGAVTLLLALLLLGPILLPALELTGHTVRADFTYQDAVAYSVAPVQALVGFVTPGFFGRGPALHWSLWERVELPYLGVPVLILGIGSVLLAAREQRRRLWTWCALALFGLLLSLGVYGIVHGLLTFLLPFFDQFRAPARALILWALGMCVLAAAGFDLALAARNQSAIFWAFVRGGAFLLGFVAVPLSLLGLLLTQGDETAFLRASLAALALVLALAAWVATWVILSVQRRNKLSASAAGALLIAVLFLELAAAGAYTDISPADPTRGFQHPEIVAFLRADPDLFRIDTDTGIAGIWQPDTAALMGLQDVYGVANPLLLRSMHDFWQSTGGRDTRRYDLLNVKYVLTRTGTPLPAGKFERVFGPVRELEVYRNRDFIPRAWWAPAAVDLANLEPPPTPPAAEVVRYTPDAIDVQLDAPGPGYLVLSETWYAGWTASVNGQPAPIEQVNGVFRAVPVPAGPAEVQLRYRPATWTWGLLLAAAGLACLVAMLVAPVVLARRRAAPVNPAQPARPRHA